MLRFRLLSSFVIIGVVLLVIWGDFNLGRDDVLGRPGILLAIFAMTATFLASLELAKLFRAGGHHVSQWTLVLATETVFFLTAIPLWYRDYPADCPIGRSGWLGFGVAAAVGIVLVSEMARFRQSGESVTRAAMSLFVVGYLGVLMSFLIWLRSFHDNAWGMSALLSMVVVVKVSDAGAYLFGRMIGGKKFAPILSPGKTWAGVCGAFVSGGIASWVLFTFIIPWLTGDTDHTQSLWSILVFGAVVTTAGMLGDLAESLIKRDTQQKDASHLMPGLGGMLDVFDSIIAAAPAAYACWVVGLVGPLS